MNTKFISLVAVLMFVAPLVTLADSTIVTSSSGSSSINPNGTVVVSTGSTQTFGITGAANVVVDGISQGALSSFGFTGIASDPTTHTISVFGPAGIGMIWCSGPLAPGWTVGLPHGGCPVLLIPVYSPSVQTKNADGSYTLTMGQQTGLFQAQ